MTWFKLDDQFHSHPKVIAAGNAAVGLYCRLGTYCADKLTDGFVPEAVARSMGTRSELKALTVCPIPDTRPLLAIVPGGYRLADFLDYNPTREAVLADREKARERMGNLRAGRKRSAEVRANTAPNLGGSSGTPVPVPPVVPTQESSSSTDTPATTDDDDLIVTPATYADHAFDRAVELVVDAKVADKAPRNPRAYRLATRTNTVAEDGELIRRMIADGDPPDTIAAFVLGHGIGAQTERTNGAPWCAPDCPTCGGDDGTRGWVWVDDGAGGLAPCPDRKALA